MKNIRKHTKTKYNKKILEIVTLLKFWHIRKPQDSDALASFEALSFLVLVIERGHRCLVEHSS